MTDNTSDLIAKLRTHATVTSWLGEAADALEASTARLREAEEAIENTSHIHGPRKVWENDRAYTLVCTVCVTEQYPCATVRTLSRYEPTTENGSAQ